MGTVVTAVFAVGIVWGGFAIILLTALRKERGKH
jgi:hypothetical protein